MSKHVAIVGGGVVGLFSAYYLVRSGLKVTIIDRTDITDGCSFGNAGMIVPSHVIPLAAPGMISQGIKWMFNSKSPFYVQPRLSGDLVSWGMKFYRSANEGHVNRSMPALRDLSLLSKELYQDLSRLPNDFLYEEKGLLMLFQTDKVGEEEVHAANAAQKLGLDVDILSKEEVSKLETEVVTNVIGGVHYRCDAHLYPNKLMAYLIKVLKQEGVEFKVNTEVHDVVLNNGSIDKLVTSNGSVQADEFVIAGGAWSPSIARKLRTKLPLLPGKGYSFTMSRPENGPLIPSILCEGKVAVTPMGNDLRFGGTMEITHVGNQKINRKRLEGIVDSIHSFYPELKVKMPSNEETWFGFRPCSPDGLPYIGRSNQLSNVIFATGHAMMGLSLGPATGKLVENIIQGHEPEVSINMFDPNRW